MWPVTSKCHSRQRGFTLLELLVALSLLALMSALSYRAVSGALEAERSVRAESARWSGLSVFFEQFERDALQAVRRPIRDESGRGRPAFILRNDEAAITEPRVEWTRLGDAMVSDTDSRRVAYRLSEGRLQILGWPVLDRAPNSTAQVVTLLEGVREFQLRVLTSSGVWQTVWPTGNGLEDLPRAVAVHLTLDDGTPLVRMFMLGGE